MLREAEKADAAEDVLHGPDKSGEELLPIEVATAADAAGKDLGKRGAQTKVRADDAAASRLNPLSSKSQDES